MFTTQKCACSRAKTLVVNNVHLFNTGFGQGPGEHELDYKYIVITGLVYTMILNGFSCVNCM